MKHIALLSLLVLGGCVLVRPPRDIVVAREPGGPAHKATSPGRDVVRVKEIKAGEVRARVIYAKEVKVEEARIGRVVRIRNPAGNWGKGDINTDRIHADEIYAKEIKANLLIADELHVHELKIRGERVRGDDDDDDRRGRGRGRGGDDD